MTKTVVVDSDAIYALYNPNDPLNKTATETFKQLAVQGFILIYPSSVIFEVISLFQRVLPSPAVTEKLRNMVINDLFPIHIIDSEMLTETAKLFNPSGSKKNTLIDCSVVAVAKRIKADGVFSYDSFYQKQKLKPAEELI